MKMTPLRFLALSLLLFGTTAHALNSWEGSTPFATGLCNRAIGALAVSPDGMTTYAGTGSGTVFRYAYSDAVPDAFTFTAQTGAALSSVATSNTITVAGINSAANISIAGGAYSINGGAYTAVAGTVNNGDTVTVKQTSSGSFSTLTTATLTIGGVSGAFNVTTAVVDGACGSATASPPLLCPAPISARSALPAP